MKMLFSVYVEM